MSGTMGRKGVLSVLVIIAGLLLSDHGAKGQTTGPQNLSEAQESTTAPTTMAPTTTTAPEITTTPTTKTASATTTAPQITTTPTTTTAPATTTALASTTEPMTTTAPMTVEPLVFESTTTVGSVLGSQSCPSYTQNREAICSSVSGTSDITAYLNSGSDLSDVCSHSMLQYGCAQIGGLPATTYAAILGCYLPGNTTVTSQEAFALITSQISLDTLGATVNILNNQIPSADISEDNRKYFLNSLWENMSENPENLTPGFLATWFTEKLYPYIPSIDGDILDCITSLSISCDSFESIVLGLSVSYSKFDQSKREQIGSWITSFLSAHSCTKTNAADSIKSYYGAFLPNVDFTSISVAFSNAEMASAIGGLTDFQLAQYVGVSNSFSSYQTALPVLQILDNEDISFIFNFLSALSADDYGQEISYSLLYTALIKLNASDDPLCRPQITTIFQVKFSFLFKYINSSILDLIVLGDCSDYQAVYAAIDLDYSSFSEDVQTLLYNYRRDYLNSEVQKSGSACTYGVSSSVWLQLNLGMSASNFSYDDIMVFNPYFDGYLAFAYLSLSQSLQLIETSELLTSASPIDFEIRISAVITFLKVKGFEYLKLFMIELKAYLIRINIQFIVNFNVRRLFLQGVWAILEQRFAEFSTNDWLIWYQEYLPFALSAITTQELSVLSNGVVDGCNNMQSIVGGLDSAIGQMEDEAKSDVVDWIVGYLQNDTSRCVESGENWLDINFKGFKVEISIKVIVALNPYFDVLLELDQFSPSQIGQIVFTKTEAHTNVTLIEIIFEYLIVENDIAKTIENCGFFWDGFNEQLIEADEFTEEVKLKLLELTTEEISLQYSIFTSEQWYQWWAVRLDFVTTVVTVDILAQIPLNISCASYNAIIFGLSGNYEETNETSRDAVYNFIISFLTKGTKCFDLEVTTVTFMVTFVGNYRFMFTYEQLLRCFPGFNPFDEGVFSTMSVEQIGDMMVLANVYESQELCVQVFAYLQTLSIENVDICIAQFTATAIKNNINISNFSVGQFILQSYLTIIKTSLVTYSQAQIIQLFEVRISFFIEFFSKTILQFFVVEDCDTLVVIVNELDKGFTSMTPDTQEDIASWIIDLLMSPNLNGCGSISQTTSVWADSTMKRFISDVSLAQIEKVYPQFDVLSVINSTSVSQKVEFIFSSADILINVETITMVLASMYAGDNVVTTSEIYSFCSDFNLKYEGLTVQYMSYEVQQEIFTFLFTSWIKNLNSMSTEEILQFEANFQFFLSGVTVTALDVIPAKMGCDVYQTIFSALSSVITDLSEDMKKSIFDAMTNYLDAQSTGSSDVCGILYTDSITYVTNIYFGFFGYASFYQMVAYYKEFNVYEVLYLCSGGQLGNLFMNSTAINNEFEAIQIFVALGKLDYLGISSFLVECTRIAKEKDIVSLPNDNIESLLFTTCWGTISIHLITEADFQWFSENALLIISSVTATAIDAIQVPDCNSQRFLVGAFSTVYDKQDASQQDAMYRKIKECNGAQLERSGSACKTDSGNSSEWVFSFYGRYDVMAAYSEFIQYNPDFSAISALVVFSGTQAADYCIASGGLRDEGIILAIFESMNSIQKVEDFLVHLNLIDSVELHNSPFASVIMSRSIEVIYTGFNTFTVDDWTYWFQVVFGNILYTISDSDMHLFGFPLPCASYQSLVKAFANVQDQMTEETRESVYNSCIRPQLSMAPAVNGVRCGEGIIRTQEWLDINMASFSIYAIITDLQIWNINFNSIEVIETVSPGQLAVIAVQNIAREEVACQVAGRVQQFGIEDANTFLNSFYAAFQTSNATITSTEIGSKLLSASVIALKSSFAKYTSDDWTNLLSAQLQPFLFSMNAEVLTSILASADCSGYFVIVKYLGAIFDDFSADTQQALAGCLTDFLDGQPSGTCPMSGESSVVASALFSKFIYYVQSDKLSSYISGFDWLSAISLLSASQQGSLAFTGDTLTNESNAAILGNSIQAMSFAQVDQFLTSFQATAEQNGFTAIANFQVRSLLLDAIYGVISKQFMSWTADQWNLYFTSRLSFFLASITEDQIDLIPDSISCLAYQSVISGLSLQYSKLSGTVQTAVAIKAKAYLSFNKPDFGPKCPVSSGGSGAWLDICVGIFSDLLSTQDIAALYPGFSFIDAVAYLTAQQLGYVACSPDVLSDKDKFSKVLDGITGATFGEFMDAFNDGAAKNGITQINNVQVKNLLLGETFCKLGPSMSSFSASDYTLLFSRLQLVISSIDAKALGFIPTDISCDSLAAIMAAFNAVENPENPEDIFDFCYSVLEAQKASFGVACTSSALSSSQWFTTYVGKYSSEASWTQITTLFPNIDVTEVKGYLTATQLASATSMISNSAQLTSLVFSFNGTMDEFYTYMQTLTTNMDQNSALSSNAKLRETLLMIFATWVYPEFSDFSVQDTQKWMTVSSSLLSSVNSTMLELIPLSCPCENFQVIVGAFSAQYYSLTVVKRQDIANFIKKFLLNKLETESDPCSSGLSVLDYIQDNCGLFCNQLKDENVTAIYSSLDPVSFVQVCSLS